jgi:hypothetical protein
MDSLAGFDQDDDEDFFRRYDAEAASKLLSAQELDAEPPPPSPEQVAHSARFRKPVALFLGAMTLLSLTALALRGSAPASVARSAQRELVAHYGAAIPAARPVASAAPAPYEPVAWEALSAAPSMCLLDPSAVTAWLSVPQAASASVEGSAFRLSHSNARVRRPAYTSSLGAHLAPSAHLASSTHAAAPKATAASPAPFTPVARFPDARQ